MQSVGTDPDGGKEKDAAVTHWMSATSKLSCGMRD